MSTDPTRTTTLRDEYTQRLRGIWARINAEIRRGIVTRDKLGLRGQSVAEAARAPDPLHDLSFARDGRSVEEFRDWLEEQAEKGRVEVFTRGENTYVRAAYERGLEQADTKLAAQGVDTAGASVEAAFNRPVHQEQLQALFTRNLTEWDGVTSAVGQQASRELTDGLQQGHNPTTIARNITDRVDKIGKKRSTDIARTEIIRSHADATLARYEEYGVDEVAGEAEFVATDDDRTCPICESLDETVMPIEEAKGLVPVHARCRCTFAPVVDRPKQLTLPT
jgi:SPP1 gp7 family putative phage head morphogenesis protein